MSYRNTQIGQEVQLNSHGNSLAGSAQGTTVQLGALNNSLSYYKDVTNPCQSYEQINYMGSFRDRNLIYLTSQGAGIYGIQLSGQYFSMFGAVNLYGTTYVQCGGGQGCISVDGNFYGSGGTGGNGGTAQTYNGVYNSGDPGGQGGPALEFQDSRVQILRVKSGNFYGGGGGGGGGGAGRYDNRDPDTHYGLGGGGGGGGAINAPGGAGGGGDFGNGVPGQGAGSTYGIGGGGAHFSVRSHGGGGGSGGNAEQPGQGGAVGTDGGGAGGSGGAAGPGISGFNNIQNG